MAEYQQIEYRIGKDGKVTEKVIKGLCRHKDTVGEILLNNQKV